MLLYRITIGVVWEAAGCSSRVLIPSLQMRGRPNQGQEALDKWAFESEKEVALIRTFFTCHPL